MDAARGDAQLPPSDAAGPGDSAAAPSDAGQGAGQDAGQDAGAVVIPPVTTSVVYIGGYDSPVHTYALDRSTGNLTEQGAPLHVGDNPTYITPDATGKRLYVANESYSGSPALSVLALDSMGLPSPLDRKVTDDGPVHSSIAPSGKFLLMASYDGGYVAVYAIESDGKLGALADKKSFAKPPSESSAQTHSVLVTPDGKYAYVPNKALNSIAQYAVDAVTGKLSELTPPVVASAGGPRHITIDKKGAFAYVVTEISAEVVAYSIGTDGKLAEIDREDGLASDVTVAEKKGAHVLITPNGKYVYASIRGNSSIASYSVGSDGRLTLIERVPSGGTTPRDFDIDSSGKFLIVANQASGDKPDGNVVVFTIGSDGKLTSTGTPVTGLQSPCAVSIVSH
jgi:6-phosphogluconolactonase